MARSMKSCDDGGFCGEGVKARGFRRSCKSRAREGARGHVAAAALAHVPGARGVLQPKGGRGRVGGVLAVAEGEAETVAAVGRHRAEEHTSELQSLMRISYAVFCLKKTRLRRITLTTKAR